MLKKFISAALCFVMVTALAACGQKNNSNTGASSADSIVVAITKDENTLTPFTYLTGTPGLDVTRLIFDSLYVYDENNNPIPWMAKSCDINEDSTQFTITLNEGLMWHDGQPVTLEDVKFTFEYAPTQQTSRWKKAAEKVASMEIVNNTIVMKTKVPELNFAYEVLAELPIIPKHIYQGVENAKTVQETVGSGMYKLGEYVQNQKYVLNAADNYFKGEVKVKTINMPIITDTSSIYQGIQSEQYTTFTGSLTPELLETFKNNGNLKISEGPGYASSMLYMNEEVKPFDNDEFRVAISMALDAQSIVDTVFLGKADAGSPGFYSPKSPYGKADLKWTYNVEEANKKLDALGYANKNADGIRLDENGKPLSFELLSSNDTLRVRAAELISEQLKAVGIEAKIKSYEKDTLDTYVWPDFDITKKRNYAMTVWGWSAPSQTNPSILLNNCSPDTKVGTYNLSSYNNDEFNALISEYNQAKTADEQKAVINKMQDVTAKTVPYYTYAYQNVLSVYNAKQYDGFVMRSGNGIINVFSFL